MVHYLIAYVSSQILCHLHQCPQDLSLDFSITNNDTISHDSISRPTVQGGAYDYEGIQLPSSCLSDAKTGICLQVTPEMFLRSILVCANILAKFSFSTHQLVRLSHLEQ